MLEPLDVHVLINRTLEVQKIQGAALRQPQDEEEILKNRLAQQIEEEERQVRRKDQVVQGRVDDREDRGRNARQESKGKKRPSDKKETTKRTVEHKGRIIDFEI